MKKSSKSVSPVMRKLSSYMAQAPRRPLPAAVTERAKYHLLDTIAAMVSGAPLLPGRRAIAYASALGGAREACIIGSRVVTSAVNAALANGMLAHADETDDAYYLALVHPGCRVVPAALAMAERNHRGGKALLRAVTAKDVERVLITLDEQGARTVSGRLMADINIQHLTALMLLDGDITFASAHDEKRVRDPAVLKLRKRIEIAGSAALAKTKTTQAIVEITTRNGERLRHHTRAVRGSATNPMSRGDVAAKARGLLAPVLGPRRAERLIDTVWNLERVKDMCRLRPLLVAK